MDVLCVHSTQVAQPYLVTMCSHQLMTAMNSYFRWSTDWCAQASTKAEKRRMGVAVLLDALLTGVLEQKRRRMDEAGFLDAFLIITCADTDDIASRSRT